MYIITDQGSSRAVLKKHLNLVYSFSQYSCHDWKCSFKSSSEMICKCHNHILFLFSTKSKCHPFIQFAGYKKKYQELSQENGP